MGDVIEGIRANTPALAASLVVKASKGGLMRVFGYNSLAGTQFIQLHDAAALPADAVVPLIVIAVAASAPWQIDLYGLILPFQNGIVICNSTTAATKTIGAANQLITALYQ